MSKHTPGPWTYYKIRNGNMMVGTVDNSTDIAEVLIDNEEMDKPDACLIAAAPELLEALEQLTANVRGCWQMAEWAIREAVGNTNYHCVQDKLEQARAAIAKARGAP
jgi:hypothetical protein